MHYDSVAALLVAMMLSYLLVSSPLFTAADSPPADKPSRVGTLDGLRGFLAMGVFFHHVVIYHAYLTTGAWYGPPSPVFTNAGEAAVCLFFMITGFLFWSQMLAQQGNPNWIAFYIGRAFRILPIYWLATAAQLLGCFALAGFHLQQPAATVGKQIVFSLFSGFASPDVINGVHGSGLLLAGVTWSLVFEWKFYASLIVTGQAARFRRLGLALPWAGFIVVLAYLLTNPAKHYQAQLMLLFLAGMSVAALHRAGVTRHKLPQSVASLAALGLIGVELSAFPNSYGWLPICLLAIAFYLIASGTSLFGLLLSRPARRLGDISYGLYLLQGLVLAAGFAIPAVRVFALASPFRYWCVAIAEAATLIVVATIAHVWIERPGIAWGKRIARRVASPMIAPATEKLQEA